MDNLKIITKRDSSKKKTTKIDIIKPNSDYLPYNEKGIPFC